MIRIEPKTDGTMKYFTVERNGESIGAVFNSHGNPLGKFNAVLNLSIGTIDVQVTDHGNTPAEAVKKAIDAGYYGAGSIDEAFNELKAEEIA